MRLWPDERAVLSHGAEPRAGSIARRRRRRRCLRSWRERRCGAQLEADVVAANGARRTGKLIVASRRVVLSLNLCGRFSLKRDIVTRDRMLINRRAPRAGARTTNLRLDLRLNLGSNEHVRGRTRRCVQNPTISCPPCFVDAEGVRDEDARPGFVNAETRGTLTLRASPDISSQATDVDGP
jgi:hypothetical protein